MVSFRVDRCCIVSLLLLLYKSCFTFALGDVLEAGTLKRQKQRSIASRHHRHVSDEWIATHDPSTTPSCPCQNASLCRPISGPPIRHLKEVFGFVNSIHSTAYFNWTFITTVAWASNDEIMCQAHAHDARAILATPSFDLTCMHNKTARSEWITNTLSMALDRFRDGVVFDYEEPLPPNSKEAMAYVLLVKETTLAFHSYNPSLQVTVCVAWSPDGIDGRNYLYKQLADASDALYVMDYDTQSQVMDGPCLANANAPYFGTIHGLERYLSLDIKPDKLILGVPWYGYRYPCLPGTVMDSRYCPIKQVPFRGVNCSDAAGSEVPLLVIQKLARNQYSIPSRDDYMDASYMNTNESFQVVQYWFDDATSFRHKFSWAKSMGLAGVGPYSLDHLNPELDPEGPSEYLQEIWSCFDAFVLPKSIENSRNESSEQQVVR